MATAKTTKGARAKTAAAKPVSAAKTATPKPKATAKTGAQTTRGARAKVATPAAPAAAPAPVLPTSISEKRSRRSDAKVNPKTGFTQGTISDRVATALLKGGASRKDIVANIEGLPETTRKGTKFVPSAVVGQVERQMRAMGFRVSSSYKLLPPAKK